MTICIGFNFDDYSLLCSDGRVTWGGEPGASIEDDRQKVYRWPRGLVTGAGLLQLLDMVRTRLDTDLIEDTTQFRQVIREERDNLRNIFANRYSTDQIEGWITSTSWFISYLTEMEGEPICRVAIINEGLDAEFGEYDSVHLIEPNTCWLIMPKEANTEQAENFQVTCTTFMKTLSEFETINEHIQYHQSVAAGLIRTASSQYHSVGSQIQIGVQPKFGQVEVSELVDI